MKTRGDLLGHARSISQEEIERGQEAMRQWERERVGPGRYAPGGSLRYEPMAVDERLEHIRHGRLSPFLMFWETEEGNRPSEGPPAPLPLVICSTLIAGGGMMYPLVESRHRT